jgi:hypothetical protein
VRKVAASCLAAFVTACSSIHTWPAFVGPGATLSARVVASREVTFFIGDEALSGQVYVLEPTIARRSRLMVFVGSEDCQAARDDGRTYRMHLSRGQIAYGLSSDREDRKWTPSLVISSCVPIAQ